MGDIDWQALAYKLGYITETEHGHSESGGTKNACIALAEILGEDALRNAVDFYVSRQRGFETARSVLWLLQPPCAMERCHEIFQSSQCEDDRVFAINLLQVVADERVLAWVPEYLADHNTGVQIWGIGIVDQLVLSDTIEPEKFLSVLEIALKHPTAYIREKAQELIEYIQDELEK